MKRILIVDDVRSIRTTLKRVLKSECYEIEEASNGKVAVELHKKNPFDLLITDIVMPKMDGLEILRRFYMDPNVLHMTYLLISLTKIESKIS